MIGLEMDSKTIIEDDSADLKIVEYKFACTQIRVERGKREERIWEYTEY